MKEKTSEVRDRIVATALRLFYFQGYNSTGINQVIAEAEVAKASLYQHFPSKEDLLLAYLVEMSKDWFKQVNDFTQPFATPREKVLSTFDLLVAFSNSVDHKGCPFQNIVSEVPCDNQKIMDVVQKHKQTMRQFFVTQLQNENLGEDIALIFEGALISSQMFHNITPIEKAKKLSERLL